MTDFVSDSPVFETPLGAANLGYAATPPTFGRAFGALFEDMSLIQAGRRAVERGQYAGSSWFDRMLATMGEAQSGLSITPAIETPLLSAEDANKRFAPEGTRITDTPIPEGIARQLGKAKQQELERENVLTRFSQSASLPTQFGAGMAAFMLDPLNLSTAFLPGIGEEAILARIGSQGFLARTVARLGAGASAGIAGQAPLTFAKYALGTEEASDYDLRAAFRDMMFAAAGNAAIHAGFGTFGDLIRYRAGARAGLEPGKEPPPPIPPEEPPPPGGGLGGPAEEMENIFIRPQPEPEEPAPPGPAPQRLSAMPVIGEELRRVAEEAGLQAEDAALLRQLRDLPRGGVPAVHALARLEMIEARLADQTITPEERRALLQRRDELLTDTTPEKLKAEAAPIEQRRVLQAQRERIAQKLEAIAAERGKAGLIPRFRELADQMAKVMLADAETKAAAAKAAASQMIEGRAVDVTPIFERKPAGPGEAAPNPRTPFELAGEQQALYEGGFAQGMASDEFARWHEAIYGEREPSTELRPGEAAKTPEQQAEAEAKRPLEAAIKDELRRVLGAEADEADLKVLDESGELQAALDRVEDADAIEQAYAQAGECLTQFGGG